eukprot:2202303-Rhodomonas_salina.1
MMLHREIKGKISRFWCNSYDKSRLLYLISGAPGLVRASRSGGRDRVWRSIFGSWYDPTRVLCDARY